MNTYGKTVIQSAENLPLYVVQIKHTLLSAFCVFSTEEAARDYIQSESALNLVYDPLFEFSAGLINEYRTARKLFSKVINKKIYITY